MADDVCSDFGREKVPSGRNYGGTSDLPRLIRNKEKAAGRSGHPQPCPPSRDSGGEVGFLGQPERPVCFAPLPQPYPLLQAGLQAVGVQRSCDRVSAAPDPDFSVFFQEARIGPLPTGSPVRPRFAKPLHHKHLMPKPTRASSPTQPRGGRLSPHRGASGRQQSILNHPARAGKSTRRAGDKANDGCEGRRRAGQAASGGYFIGE